MVLERQGPAPGGDGEDLAAVVDLAKTYDNGTAALGGLSLTIKAGEVLALVGPSGCGKSTLLRALAGLTPTSGGHIAWRGGTAPTMGFVFQEPTLMPWARVADNVALPLVLRRELPATVRARVDAALGLVGLWDAADAYPRQLSGGMRMRVSIARALIDRPSLILMDEPFAALDEINRFRMNDELLRLRRETGATILFVTHSIFEAAYLADRIAVMTDRPGRVAAMVKGDTSAGRDAGFRHSSAFSAICREVAAHLAASNGNVAA